MSGSDPAAVGVDVGGTKLLALSVTGDGDILQRRRLTSPRADSENLVATVADLARELAPGRPLGLGVAGIVSRDGALRYSPNLQLGAVPLRARLAEDLEVPVRVHNDATAALYGELRAGVAVGGLDVVMLTLGTGIGGAVAVEGDLLVGVNGMAGELGHIPIVDGGRSCPCGSDGCLEAYAAGPAIAARARELLADGDPGSSLRDLETVEGRAVTRAAGDGDALAVRVLTEAGYHLGVGILALINIFDPELVILGGGAAPSAAPWLVPVAADVVGRRVMGHGRRPPPPIAVAALGDDAGAVGAALHAHDLAVDLGQRSAATRDTDSGGKGGA